MTNTRLRIVDNMKKLFPLAFTIVLFFSCSTEKDPLDQLKSGEPIVTAEATSITHNSAILCGYVNPSELAQGVEIGIIVSEEETPSVENGTKLVSVELDKYNKFFVTVNNLSPETKYYYKAFLNVSGTYRVGDVKSFTTEALGFVDVESISLNKASLEMVKGHTEQLTATFLPSNATDKSVIWSSSDPSIVTVDQNGLVTARSIGTAMITVSTQDGGSTDFCFITVFNSYRIKSLMMYWEEDDKQSGDMYTYTWNADGTIASVDMAWAKDVYSTMKFNWKGNTVTVVDAKKDNQPVCTITVDDQKHAVKIVQDADSQVGKGWKTLECTYNANGFLTLAKCDGVVKTVQSIDKEGNIEWWGRVGIANQVNESPNAAGWCKKMLTYYNTENAAGIHGEWDEDVAVKRWFYETNLVGRASAHIVRTAWWYGVVDKHNNVVKQEYAAKLAYYPLDVDANNCVVVETELYDTKEKYESNPNGMTVFSRTAFTYGMI